MMKEKSKGIAGRSGKKPVSNKKVNQAIDRRKSAEKRMKKKEK